jgi:hypothetical protein
MKNAAVPHLMALASFQSTQGCRTSAKLLRSSGAESTRSSQREFRLTSLLHEEFEIHAIVQVELTLYLFCPFYSRFCKNISATRAE